VASFDGDGKPALETALDQPSAVACAFNGDIYIADTMNNRIRVIDHATGLIRTLAGNGQVSEIGSVGDGGPAIDAHLYMPSDVAVAPNGDVYIADMHHNRVRMVDAKSGVITTVAGNGSFGNAPDSVPAIEASLAGPAGIAVTTGPDGKTSLFIADSYNALVRMVGPDGIMRIVSDGSGIVFGVPSRVAYAHTRGWLYVGDAMEDKLVALRIPQLDAAQAAGMPLRPDTGDAPRR
jgi:sugar lactone lactonase YvrE